VNQIVFDLSDRWVGYRWRPAEIEMAAITICYGGFFEIGVFMVGRWRHGDGVEEDVPAKIWLLDSATNKS